MDLFPIFDLESDFVYHIGQLFYNIVNYSDFDRSNLFVSTFQFYLDLLFAASSDEKTVIDSIMKMPLSALQYLFLQSTLCFRFENGRSAQESDGQEQILSSHTDNIYSKEYQWLLINYYRTCF